MSAAPLELARGSLYVHWMAKRATSKPKTTAVEPALAVLPADPAPAAPEVCALPALVDPFANPLPSERGGPLSEYNADKALLICERVANGETLSAVCREPGMPAKTTFKGWVLRVPELAEVWRAARHYKADSLFDEAMDIARMLRNGRYGPGDSSQVNALRTAIETLKWAAGKLNPQEYGEKALSGPAIQVVIQTSLDLGNHAATGQVAEGPEFYTLTASVPLPDASAETISSQSAPKSRDVGARRRHDRAPAGQKE